MSGGESRPSVRDIGNLDSFERALGGLNRRDFLKYCTGVAVTLGLSPAFGVRIANAATAPARPPVFWLSGQACTGCTESLLRAYHPTLETLILDMISLDYHETLNVGAGHQAEAFNYGFIPHALSEDGDPVDAAVLGQMPVTPGVIIRSRPIGVLIMEDEAGVDEKILCVPVDELHPFYAGVASHRELPDILRDQMSHFFGHYKDLEPGKWVEVKRWGEPEEAFDLIRQSVNRLKEKG